MIDVPPASIVTAQHYANNGRSIERHPAQPRITRQKFSHALFIITFGNLDSFGLLPDPKRRVIVVYGKLSDVDLAIHLITKL